MLNPIIFSIFFGLVKIPAYWTGCKRSNKILSLLLIYDMIIYCSVSILIFTLFVIDKTIESELSILPDYFFLGSIQKHSGIGQSLLILLFRRLLPLFF